MGLSLSKLKVGTLAPERGAELAGRCLFSSISALNSAISSRRSARSARARSASRCAASRCAFIWAFIMSCCRCIMAINIAIGSAGTGIAGWGAGRLCLFSSFSSPAMVGLFRVASSRRF